MLVKAKEIGFYGMQRRYPGDTFELKSKKHFSKTWMVALEEYDETEDAPQAAPAKPEGKAGSAKKKNATEKALAGEPTALSEVQPEQGLPVTDDVTDASVI